jgi:hypothetical protein
VKRLFGAKKRPAEDSAEGSAVPESVQPEPAAGAAQGDQR